MSCATDAAKGGIVSLLAAPELYAAVGAAFVGMVFQQSAYRGGPLNASMPTMTVAKPAAGSLLGVFVLGETLQPGEGRTFVLVGAAVLTVIATAALARGEAETAQAHAEDVATGRLMALTDS